MSQIPPNNKAQKNTAMFKGLIHIAMGIVYVLIGAVIIFFSKEKTLFDLSPTVSYAIAGLMIAYGLFRLYRGLRRVTGKEQGW